MSSSKQNFKVYKRGFGWRPPGARFNQIKVHICLGCHKTISSIHPALGSVCNTQCYKAYRERIKRD